jgi:hypothetical protein
MLVILATQEAEIGGSWVSSRSSWAKVVRPYLKNKIKTKGLEGRDSSGTVLAYQKNKKVSFGTFLLLCINNCFKSFKLLK